MVSVRWSLMDGAQYEHESGVVSVTTTRMRRSFADSDGLLVQALTRLSSTPSVWDDLLDSAESAVEVARLDHGLRQLHALGLLCKHLHTSLGPLATWIPTAHRRPAAVASASRVLSRFAHLRRVGDALCLETPLAPSRVVLHDWRGPALIGCLQTGCESLPPGISRDVAEAFSELLAEAGMCAPDPPWWSFHDLVFHAASRLGRHDRPYGGTYPYRDRTPPPPALRPAMSEARIPLPLPDIARMAAEDPTLSRAVEQRHSERRHAATPLTLGQVGEFLHRTCRLTKMGFDGVLELPRRPHANAGAIYELETYLTVDRVAGIEPDLYRYVPEAHALERCHAATAARTAMLDFVQRGTGLSRPPPVLVTLTSRIGRLAWKYESIAYASTLKDVGIVLHAMYLAATAMGLAACALGGGDSDLFAAAAGHDYYEETAVGEFMLANPEPGECV